MTTIALRTTSSRSLGDHASDWAALVRPRIAVMVLVTVAVGAALAAGGVPPLGVLAHALVGTLLVAGASSALNQLMERDTDALMRRTEGRPLPARRIGEASVLAFAALASSLGVAELALGASPAAALVAVVSLGTYVLAYTPLKRRTTLNTLVGAVPGALPPLIGWAAVRGDLDLGAFSLFAIVFVWQFPHFLAIAWLNREDYARAGLKMLPAVAGGAPITGRQAVNYALALVPVSLLPAQLGLAGEGYLLGALWLGVGFLATAIHFMVDESRPSARRLLVASIVYLPALLGLLVLERLPGTA